MRIATWNIGGGFISSDKKQEYDLENIQYFIDELKSIQPDIVCFQEAHVSNNNNQPEKIAEALNFDFVRTEFIADSHLKDGEKLSISIISKYPITSSKFNMLTNPNLEFIWKDKKAFSHDKGFLESTIDYNGSDIKVFSGHMVPYTKFKRNFLEEDFKEIRNEIENIILKDNNPKIVCADMNFNENIHELLPNIFSKNFTSLIEGKATTPKEKRYDKIIASEEWLSTNSKIIPGKADHYLCIADIELNKK